jgi:flagellar protein FliS
VAYNRQIQEYQKAAVNSASPVGLIVMLYDGAISFMEQGKHAMAVADFERQNTYLQKAQKIIFELLSCLDMEKGGEISANLMALYTFALDQLIEANLKGNAEAIDRAMRVFAELRQSWVAIEDQLKCGGEANAA